MATPSQVLGFLRIAKIKEIDLIKYLLMIKFKVLRKF